MEEEAPVSSLPVKLASLSTDGDSLVRAIDAWCAEVMWQHEGAVTPGDLPSHRYPTLDDLVGTYLTRDRLSRFAGSEDLHVVRAADHLLRSFTVEASSQWAGDHGYADFGGNEWWWSRLPISGSIREELDRIERHRPQGQ
ncbi:MAG: hypothetical protein AAGA65_17935 [Actinomycetota bacterium]